jgi:hypothetical protein
MCLKEVARTESILREKKRVVSMDFKIRTTGGV